VKKQSKRNQSGRRPGRPVNPHPRWLSLGRLWLDFTFTGGSGAFARFERLHEPTDLDEWFAISSLGVEGIGSTAEDVRRARAFRSVLWEVSRALVEDRPISPQLIKALNETAAEPPLTRRLDPSAASASWVEPTVRAGLSTIARDAIELTRPRTAGSCSSTTPGPTAAAGARPSGAAIGTGRAPIAPGTQAIGNADRT
jgi:hypothetical protein